MSLDFVIRLVPRRVRLHNTETDRFQGPGRVPVWQALPLTSCSKPMI